MKKIISILLSVCLLSGIMLLPVSANTAPIATGADGKVELTYYGYTKVIPTFETLERGKTYRFCDRNASSNYSPLSTNLPEFLDGTTYFQPSFPSYQDAKYKDANTTFTTFKLYESATVYYITQSNVINPTLAQCYIKNIWNTYENSGWVKSTDGGYELTSKNDEATMWEAEPGKSVIRNPAYIYQFDIEATKENPYILNIGGMGKLKDSEDSLGGAYSVAFKFHGESEEDSYIAKDTLGNVELTTYKGTSGKATFADSMSYTIPRYHDKPTSYKFNETGFPECLNGTTFLQTGLNDWKDEGGSTAVIDDYTQTFMSFKIYENATVYYITQHTNITEKAQPYINDWFADTTKKNAGWMTGETHTNALGELEYTYSTDDSDAKVWTTGCGESTNTKEIRVFKFEIEASKESPYILDVAGKGTLPKGGSLNSLYTLAFDWDDEEKNTITVNAGANGTASVTGTHSVVTGHTVPLTITADKGYIIDSATVNGVPQVVSGDSASLNVTVSEDTVVDVTFAAIEMPEELTTYTQNIFVSASETFMVGNNEVTSPAGVLFAKAGEAYGEMERTSCGMIFSKTPMTIDEVKGGTKGEQAQAEGTHANGNFGIRFYGAGIVNGNTYYAVPYAVYTDGVTTTTLYGTEVLTFTIPME